MEIICVVECDDCGKSIITDEKTVSLFVLDEIMGISVCPQCGQPIVVFMDKVDALKVAEKGVKVFSWLVGQQVSSDTLR